MWKWKTLKNTGHAYGASTFIMEVPGGYVLRVQHSARQGRGPNYAEHPIPVCETMTFIPCTDATKGNYGPPCEEE